MKISSDLVALILKFFFNWLTRNLLTGIVIYCIYIGIYGYNYWFSWHVFLCTLGIFPLMNEGLMLFPKDEVWTSQLNRKKKYFIHGLLFLLGAILVIAGTIVYIYYTPSIPHFNTIHGVSGLVAIIFYIISIFIGVLANYSQRLVNGGLGVVIIKSTHNILGLLGYIVGVVSLCYAFYTSWFIFYTSKESRLVVLIATILGTLWTINGSLASCYNQIKTIIRLLRR